MKLYDSPLSGNANKVRLILALLDIEYRKIPVDLKADDHHKAEFSTINL